MRQPFRPHSSFFPAANHHRGRGFVRPTGLIYPTPYNNARGNYPDISSPNVRNFLPTVRPAFSTSAPITAGQPRFSRPHLLHSHPGQNFNIRSFRPPIICYNCGIEGHIACNCYNNNSASVNYIQADYYDNNLLATDYYSEHPPFQANAVLFDYYD